MKEKTIKRKWIYKGRIISLREDKVRLSNGVVSHREIIEHPGAVIIIAVTKDNKIVMVRQFRKTAEKVLLEIPAGLAHKGESGINAAKRELQEETGYKAGRIKFAFKGYSSPGVSTEVMSFYLATQLERAEQNCDHDEMISVAHYPLKKCLAMIRSGKITDTKSIAGIMFANTWKH